MTESRPIRFERTYDAGLLREILTVPSVYRMISEDTAPPVEQFQLEDHPLIWNVLAFDGEELLGAFIFHPEGAVCWQVHTALLPVALAVRGRAIAAARGVIQWIWANSPCRRITTRVPAFNPLALRLARKADMMEFGVNEMSYLKYGKLHDQTLLGISKPEVG